MDFLVKQKINKLSRKYNYFDRCKAIEILAKLSEEEAKIVLSNQQVQATILGIDDWDTLRLIFANSPAFFQEIMFSNKKIQNILITPRRTLKNEGLIKNYNKTDYVFTEKEKKEFELFLRSIKSSNIYEQLIENKLFQMVVVLFSENELSKKFFKNIDVVKLFYNIIGNDDVFKTRSKRRKNVLWMFNQISNHLLLSDDYLEILDNPKRFLRVKEHYCRDEEIIFVNDETLSLLTTPLLEQILDFKNIDYKYIMNYMKPNVLKKISEPNFDFNEMFSHLLTGGNDCFNGLDYIFFNILISEMSSNVQLKEEFFDFVYGILCNDNTFDQNEESMIKQVLYSRFNNFKTTKKQCSDLFSFPDVIKTTFYLKFGKLTRQMHYLQGISSKQIIYLNVKHINQIISSMNLQNEDELSNIYSYAIKLYLVFGLERALKILNGDYGTFDRVFYDNLSRLDVSNVEMVKEGKKFIPKIGTEFINFMFADQNNNHFRNMLEEQNSLLYKNWSYLCNNYESIKERCHGQITLGKVSVILKELSPERELGDVTPNNYKLQENEILNDICLGNKTKKPNTEIYKNVLDIYEKMKQRVESSIPYVKGAARNGYHYEMMKFNDPIAFTLGFKGNCCIRINDIAHKHLLHSLLCRNGRILLIYDEDNQFAGFVPLKRNGEVLIANSVECVHKIKNYNTISAFEDAINDIVSVSEENESDPIKLVCIGSEAYAKPKGERFPNDVDSPTIFEKDDPVYCDTDSYHKILDILYMSSSLDLSNIKYGDPKYSYMDPRKETCFCDFRSCSLEEKEEALKIINAVRYENADLDEKAEFSLFAGYGFTNCIYNEDWYIVTDNKGRIYGDFLEFNPKAEEEYKLAFSDFMGISYDKFAEENGKEGKLVYQKKNK